MLTRPSITALAALVVTLLVAAAPAHARDVYLNGVKLDASVLVTSQHFPSCDVRIDDKGDVHITAKGFKIDVKPQAGTLSKRYWLVSKQPRRGMAQYDVDVFLNGKLVKRVRSRDEAVILDVTRHVRPGANDVKLVAVKAMGDRRLSSSPADTLEIILGEGDSAGGTISITRTLVTFVRTAQETRSFSDAARFEAR